MKRFIGISLFVMIYLYSGNSTYNVDFKNQLQLEDKKKVNSYKTEKVTVTMYNPVPEQTNSQPFITADLSKINKKNPSMHRWVAVSYNLHTRYGGYLSFNDTIYLYGTGKKDGLYVVKDLMNPRYKNRIDILESIDHPLYKYENCYIFAPTIDNSGTNMLTYLSDIKNNIN